MTTNNNLNNKTNLNSDEQNWLPENHFAYGSFNQVY